MCNEGLASVSWGKGIVIIFLDFDDNYIYSLDNRNNFINFYFRI